MKRNFFPSFGSKPDLLKRPVLTHTISDASPLYNGVGHYDGGISHVVRKRVHQELLKIKFAINYWNFFLNFVLKYIFFPKEFEVQLWIIKPIFCLKIDFHAVGNVTNVNLKLQFYFSVRS